jgi:hypothetical protein
MRTNILLPPLHHQIGRSGSRLSATSFDLVPVARVTENFVLSLSIFLSRSRRLIYSLEAQSAITMTAAIPMMIPNITPPERDVVLLEDVPWSNIPPLGASKGVDCVGLNSRLVFVAWSSLVIVLNEGAVSLPGFGIGG